MSDFAIKVENLSKRYHIGLKEELPDTRRILELLGWRPQYSLGEVLQAVIAYEQKKTSGGRLA
jgi:nucleoside-diphosphate-sugar epimerase